MNAAKRYPAALTVAGSDSGGGAGIQADLKTFSALGVYGASAITAITIQNTQEVRGVDILSPETVQKQMEVVLDDITIDALKTGMLPTPEIIETVASVIDRYPIKNVVIDPVMVATSGARLSSANTLNSFREFLYPRLTLLTPNIPEAEALSGMDIHNEKEMYKAAEVLLKQGCCAVLMKGGHLRQRQASDILFRQDFSPVCFSSDFIETKNLHGTGCSLASAVTALLALGHDMENAVGCAKEYITSAITAGFDITTGKGHGPINHFFAPVKLNSVADTKMNKNQK